MFKQLNTTDLQATNGGMSLGTKEEMAAQAARLREHFEQTGETLLGVAAEVAGTATRTITLRDGSTTEVGVNQVMRDFWANPANRRDMTPFIGPGAMRVGGHAAAA